MAQVPRFGPVDMLLFSAWCGLAGGLAEVVTRVAARALDPTRRLYLMSRHFPWATPLANLVFFLGLGIILTSAARTFPRPFRWLGPRLACALAILPSLMIAGPGIYPEAWLLLAIGVACRAVPWLEADAGRRRRFLLVGLAAVLIPVPILAAWPAVADRLGERGEAARPLPPEGSPNVLLIVLDTVRADHLSVYGYHRPTTPALVRLAARAVRFDEARATAPWTLASHASFFTGRWPHELGVRWLTPLPRRFTSIAEYLGSRGYATAGFVANAMYCSYDTGLDRGFTHYEDYRVHRLNLVRTSTLADSAIKALFALCRPFDPGIGHPIRARIEEWFLSGDRKFAATVNDEFTAWLAKRREPRRPFFAFLNYLDTHAPYIPPPGTARRFGSIPATAEDLQILFDRWVEIDKVRMPRRYRTLAQDAYDDCLGYLDDQLGALFERLETLGLLEDTLIVVVGDHGEALGEHDLYTHGESLYRPEIRVPLLIKLPGDRRGGQAVAETVSLRDLPATIAHLTGLEEGSPFPGRALIETGKQAPSRTANDSNLMAVSELSSANPTDPNQGRSPARRGPLVSLAEGPLVYIRNEGDGTEELFDERHDTEEWINLARRPSMQSTVRRLREQLERIVPASSTGRR